MVRAIRDTRVRLVVLVYCQARATPNDLLRQNAATTVDYRVGMYAGWCWDGRLKKASRSAFGRPAIEGRGETRLTHLLPAHHVPPASPQIDCVFYLLSQAGYQVSNDSILLPCCAIALHHFHSIVCCIVSRVARMATIDKFSRLALTTTIDKATTMMDEMR
jgi:hypothetical protein